MGEPETQAAHAAGSHARAARACSPLASVTRGSGARGGLGGWLGGEVCIEMSRLQRASGATSQNLDDSREVEQQQQQQQQQTLRRDQGRARLLEEGASGRCTHTLNHSPGFIYLFSP